MQSERAAALGVLPLKKIKPAPAGLQECCTRIKTRQTRILSGIAKALPGVSPAFAYAWDSRK